MPISLFYGIQSDYIQVVCLQDRYLPKLESLGWKKNPDDLPVASNSHDEEHEESVVEVSLAEKIMSSDSKDEIEKLIKDSFKIDLDKRGNLDTVKEKAIQIIRCSLKTE